MAETIAILGLEVVGAIDVESTRAARELTNALRSGASNGPYTIAPNSDKELIDEKLMHNCEDERKECMAKIGRKLNSDYLLYGKIERQSRQSRGPGIGYRVSLRLLKINNLHLTTWSDFIPSAETSGTKIVEWGNQSYDQLLANSRPRQESHDVADRVLVDATNKAFWQLTRHKPGQKLDMTDPQDRAMSKTWLDLHAQIRGRRDRAIALARRMLNEMVTPYILIIEQRDGSLTHRTFERRSNLDAQYAWLLDQPEYYTYLAMFDFTQNRNAPIHHQFAISKRQQMTTSGWYG